MTIEPICGDLAPEALRAQTLAPDDRRRMRRRSVLLRASIYPIDNFCDARIRNVSATGLMGEADIELAIGQTLHITFDEQRYYGGTVKWTLDRRFGLELPNAPEIFGHRAGDVDHGSQTGQNPRAPRMTFNETARLVAGRPPRPAMIRNLSCSGMLIDTSPGLIVGQHLLVRVGKAPPVYGRTQWSLDGRIGFRAQHRISLLAVANVAD